MTATTATFRADFPEFSGATDAKIAFWLNVATNLVNPNQWSDLTDTGVELLTAHYVSIDMKEARAAGAPGGVPGGAVGVLTAKAAGGISGSYDVASAAEPDAGQLNLTSYGKRYAALRRLFGAGGLQI